jgi:hypothetical protein
MVEGRLAGKSRKRFRTALPSSGRIPSAVYVQIVVEVKSEGVTKENIARVGSCGPRPSWLEEAGCHTRFHHQLGIEITPTFAVGTAYKVGSQRPAAAEGSKLTGQAHQREGFAILSHGKTSEPCRLLAGQRDAAPANIDLGNAGIALQVRHEIDHADKKGIVRSPSKRVKDPSHRAKTMPEWCGAP